MTTIISICFRVDANEELGLGHVSRCRSLMISFLKAHKCRFSIISNNKDLIKKFIAPMKADFYRIGSFHSGNRPDLLIVDVPNISKHHEHYLRERADIVTCIDDNGEGVNFQNILIRPNLLQLSKPTGVLAKNYWSGKNYLILHPDFSVWARKKVRIPEVAQKIVVCFGGSDPNNFTQRVIPFLKKIESPVVVTIILGAAYSSKAKVMSMIKGDSRFKIMHNISHMAPALAKSDLAIISGGTLLYECCSLGIPSIVLSQNHSQKLEAKICHDCGAAISLGASDKISDVNILNTLKRIISDYAVRRRMSERGRKFVSADGANFIVSKLLPRLKKVAP